MVGSLLYYYGHIFTRGAFRPGRALFREYFAYAGYVFLGANAGILFTQMDQQAVIFFLSPDQAGYYATFLSALGINGLVFVPMFVFLFPVVSDLIFRGDRARVREVFRVIYNGSLVLALGMA